MFKKDLEKALQDVFKKKYPNTEKLKLETPKNKAHGDYATNFCFMLKNSLKKSPIDLAIELSDCLPKDQYSCMPLNGFINITLTEESIWEKYSALFIKKPQYPIQKETIILEYLSANPTGPLHIGHGRWAVIGDVLANLLSHVGHTVHRETYINDAGNQMTLFYESVKARKNNEDVPENGYQGQYIATLAQAETDPLSAVLSMQKETLSQIDVQFDQWFSEKKLHSQNQIETCITQLKAEGLIYSLDKATWFKSTEFGDDKDRVLVKSDGAYTYFAVDIAYHWEKLERGFNTLINIWGADHHGYVSRMTAAISGLNRGKDSPITFKVILGQLVALYREGKRIKMSKRTGEMITLSEVIEEIGADATRYFLVEKSPDSHIDFDLDLAKKKSSENPVFYIQYAHARICSILKKVSQDTPTTPQKISLAPSERNLLMHSLKIHDHIYEAATHYQAHKLCLYLLKLAKLFHGFYENCPILKASEEEKYQRIIILKNTQKALQLCLGLLGISAPESM